MPPAATTGTGTTASTTRGTRAKVETSPATWPPASTPCATITSMPAAAARSASATEPTWWKTLTPPACARPTYGVGSPQKNERTGTRSSRQTATWSSAGKCRIRFTPNGLSVSARTRRISRRKSGGGHSWACRMPSPPALLTAATRSGPVRSGPIGAAMMGCSIPSMWQRFVFMTTSATGQQGSHQDVAPRVALRFGQQTISNALVQTFDGPDIAFRLLEGGPYHRLGDGTQEAGVGAGVSRHVAAAPKRDDKGYGDFHRLGAVHRKGTVQSRVLSLQRRQQFLDGAEIARHRQAFVLLSCQPARGDQVETGVVEDIIVPVGNSRLVGIARTGQQQLAPRDQFAGTASQELDQILLSLSGKGSRDLWRHGEPLSRRMRPAVADTIEQGRGGQPVEPVDGVEAGGEADRTGRQQRAVKRAPHRSGVYTRRKEAVAAGLFQVGEQLVEVVAGQVAVDRLNGLPGAASQSRGDGPHDPGGIAPVGGAKIQDGDRLRCVGQRQARDGVVNPVLEGLDRGELRPRVLVVVSRPLHPCRCWHKEHLFPIARQSFVLAASARDCTIAFFPTSGPAGSPADPLSS